MQTAAKLLALILAVTPLSTSTLAQTSSTPSQQPAPGKPIAFDTVSVKPNKSNDAHPGSMLRPDGFDAENITPIWVMCWAFGQTATDESCFSGLPGWASTERFDIIAKVAGPDVPVWGHMSDAEKQRMIREVFADRFKLQTHTETPERPVFALVLAKGGAKLTPSKPGGRTLIVPALGNVALSPTEGWFGYSHTGIVAGNMTMKEFAAHLTTMNLGRPVQDQTGLTGRYDFKLDFAPIQPSAAPSEEGEASEPAGPEIFTAIQEQLGLKLEPTKAPVPVLVIDHIERPTPN